MDSWMQIDENERFANEYLYKWREGPLLLALSHLILTQLQLFDTKEKKKRDSIQIQ